LCWWWWWLLSPPHCVTSDFFVLVLRWCGDRAGPVHEGGSGCRLQARNRHLARQRRAYALGLDAGHVRHRRLGHERDLRYGATTPCCRRVRWDAWVVWCGVLSVSVLSVMFVGVIVGVAAHVAASRASPATAAVVAAVCAQRVRHDQPASRGPEEDDADGDVAAAHRRGDEREHRLARRGLVLAHDVAGRPHGDVPVLRVCRRVRHRRDRRPHRRAPGLAPRALLCSRRIASRTPLCSCRVELRGRVVLASCRAVGRRGSPTADSERCRSSRRTSCTTAASR
jgi:hypothetical protein